MDGYKLYMYSEKALIVIFILIALKISSYVVVNTFVELASAMAIFSPLYGLVLFTHIINESLYERGFYHRAAKRYFDD